MQSTAEIPLTRGYVALIDEADYEAVTGAGAWCANTSSADHVVYAQRGFRGADGLQRTVQMHRFLTGWDVELDLDGTWEVGRHFVELKISQGGEVRTAPSDGFYVIRVVEDLDVH
ncbi:TPA: hypothetical protein ACFPCA_002187 [Neisseria meningitidis]